MATLSRLTTPSCFRDGVNSSGADIAAKRVLKQGTLAGEVALATSPTDTLLGITDEIIYDTKSGSYQKSGRGILTAGAAVTVGQDITVDSTSRGVPATQAAGAPQRVLGRAATAASGAGVDFAIELETLGILYTGVAAVADRTALKAIAAGDRYNGLIIMVLSDQSLWRFHSTAAQSSDGALGGEILVAVPAAGTGRWIRANPSFVAALACGFGTADAAVLMTMPEGFVARLAALPWWENSVAWSGGSSSAIGMSSGKTGYTTKGDLLGGAAGDVAAGLGAGSKPGTIGPKVDTLTEHQALLLVEGDTLLFDRITSVFTAGAANIRVPLIVTMNTSPLTP